MSEALPAVPLKDEEARRRFREEWRVNFAVSANAGSGKTTAISERLAQMALSPEASAVLPKTAVVTFTKKAAAQIGQRARQVLLKRLAAAGSHDLRPLDLLERAFFGTIHSFCLQLAQRYGQTLGINLNPQLVVEEEEAEDALWEEFVGQDEMRFGSLTGAELAAFLRHVPLEEVFAVARKLGAAAAEELARGTPGGPPSAPSAGVLARILELKTKNARGLKNLERSQAAARRWDEKFRAGEGFLPLYKPTGKTGGLEDLAEEWMAPLKRWLAGAAGVLAAELSARYRNFRYEKGVQTYADQIDGAMAVLRDPDTLARIRAEGWRVILDEAQDTDPQQFAVLVEIARPEGAEPGTWPEGGGAPPRAGHFCLVGDGQQAIYGTRADVRNFTRHLAAFARGDGGELLVFQVTFRTPQRVIGWLNEGFPGAFGPEQPHNLGVVPEGAPEGAAPLLQVRYEPLEPSDGNVEGRAERFALVVPEHAPSKVDGWLAEEARQLAAHFVAHGPAGAGAARWSDVAVIVPRVKWLAVVKKEFDRAGLKSVLQIRRSPCRDNPAYAWLTGLMAVVCDPDNAYEWFGVLREVFAVSDALLAEEVRRAGKFSWEEPEAHPEPLRGALAAVRPWVLRADEEGMALDGFVRGLAAACGLEARARAIDGSGALATELARLLAGAAAMAAEGAGPRDWFRHLLAGLDTERPDGGADAEALSLISSHSAKGLEWPVVVPMGLWRGIGKKPEQGLRLVAEPGAVRGLKMYFDQASMPAETVEARERERRRELVRLLYVTWTRAKARLVLPWGEGFGCRTRAGEPSFAELWASPEKIAALPAVAAGGAAGAREDGDMGAEAVVLPAKEVATAASVLAVADGFSEGGAEAAGRMRALPRRVLPHELAHRTDQARALRHEAGAEALAPVRLVEGDEAVDYGIWWHETMEFLPWEGDEAEVTRYLERELAQAGEAGFRARGEAELAKLRAGEAWRVLRERRWTRIAELAVLAPLAGDAWIDGVVDLALHDPARRELWIVDWKTNRLKRGEREADLLARLRGEYAAQLQAYGRGAAPLFAGQAVRLWVFASATGGWGEIPLA